MGDDVGVNEDRRGWLFGSLYVVAVTTLAVAASFTPRFDLHFALFLVSLPSGLVAYVAIYCVLIALLIGGLTPLDGATDPVVYLLLMGPLWTASAVVNVWIAHLAWPRVRHRCRLGAWACS